MHRPPAEVLSLVQRPRTPDAHALWQQQLRRHVFWLHDMLMDYHATRPAAVCGYR